MRDDPPEGTWLFHNKYMAITWIIYNKYIAIPT